MHDLGFGGKRPAGNYSRGVSEDIIYIPFKRCLLSAGVVNVDFVLQGSYRWRLVEANPTPTRQEQWMQLKETFAGAPLSANSRFNECIEDSLRGDSE